MPRVVMLTTCLAPGGAETQVFRLSLELSRRGWEPAVVSLLPPTSYVNALEAAGVAVFSLGMRPGRPDPRGLARLAAVLRRLRPQVLHSHMFHANLLARLARLFCPVPVVISTLHSAAESPSGADHRFLWSANLLPKPAAYPGTRWRDWLYGLTDPMADAVVAVSRAVADRHAACGAVRPGKLRVIPNGVDTAVFHPDPERRERVRRELGLQSEFVWLAAGRLMWKKDYPTLLRAFAGLRGATLLIAGVGPQEAELKGLAAELGIDARFLGRVDDMPALMNAADALALSSVVEGLPVALLEAASSGLPAVAADAGGVREILGGGEAGFVVPPGNPAALAAAMAKLASLPADARERMSRAARATAVTRFDLSVVVSQWEAAYRDMLENASQWT
jgi:glycosyltransferase involved in cell wall biosynthesis